MNTPTLKDPLVSELREAITSHGLVRRNQTLLLALSGGVDSMTLLYGLHSLSDAIGFDLYAGHVNHRLRGEESDEDARFVMKACENLGVSLLIGDVDVRGVHRERGGTLEEVARTERYRILTEMVTECGADLLVTAHHLDDQAETVLMHLLRGGGLRGLCGMSRGPERGIIRPLLGITRNAIREAAERWRVEWREDSSNSSLEMTRNRLRHSLLPLLSAEWNPNIAETLARTADIVSADDEMLETLASDAFGRVVRDVCEEHIILDRKALTTYPLAIRRRLVRRCALGLRTVHEPLNYGETERLVTLLDRGRGEVVLRGKLRAWSNAREAWIEAADAWTGPDTVAVGAETEVPFRGRLRVWCDDASAGSVRFSLEAVNPPLRIRRWIRGDRIQTTPDGGQDLVAHLAKNSDAAPDPRGLVVIEDSTRILYVVDVVQAYVTGASPYLCFTWFGESLGVVGDAVDDR
jgi:tRNA(Ile)-lysidine synthetase-like protein